MAATMAKAARAAAAPPHRSLPDEIVIWEILVRFPPTSLLRCRAVCRAWLRVTTTSEFLLSHHGHQPNLPVLSSQRNGEEICKNIIVFDHRAAPPHAHLQHVARLDGIFYLEASCDGLLILSTSDITGAYISVCNPTTRQHAPLRQLWGFALLGMYPHRPTGEYRLLLQRRSCIRSSKYRIGCYVFTLGSDQPPRYIGYSKTRIASALFNVPAQLRDSLHWYPVYYPRKSNPPYYEAGSGPMEYEPENELVIFDTIAESFRQIRTPLVPTQSCIFEMDDMLGIYSCNKAMEIVDIWLLQNYESEVWDLKYRVDLPIAEIRGKLEGLDGDAYWYVTVTSGDGDMFLLVSFGHWLFYVDIDGVLVASFHDLNACTHRLKQTLLRHDFFTTPDGCAVDASPFI